MEDTLQLNFVTGVSFQDLSDGTMVTAHVGDEDIIVVRRGEAVFAIGASCTHYHGALASGLIVGDTVRCPLHHACFSLRNGEVLRAPALDPITCWRVERIGDKIFIREKLDATHPRASPAPAGSALRAIVIVGGGAAALAAAVTLRREGYENALTLISADDSEPYDRPNLSKDFLAGTAPEDWLPLRAPDFYTENRIDVVLNARAASLELPRRRILLEDGRYFEFDALLLATGAEPVRLAIPGATRDQVHYLRTIADCRAVLAKAAEAKRVIVVGASFIGLEVAAALRARQLEVHLIGRESVPMERVLGPEVGRWLKELHESHGVQFHLGATVASAAGRTFVLSDATKLDADFIVAGVGVRPAVALAESAGLMINDGIVVNEYLQTSASGIYAAGDIARWPDPHSGQRIRVEHWVLAQRQGQTAARNILGYREKFEAVPFFWSQHYDVAINYVGHAARWDTITVEGTLAARDCAIRYQDSGRTRAVATILRDRESLEAERTMEAEKS